MKLWAYGHVSSQEFREAKHKDVIEILGEEIVEWSIAVVHINSLR